VAAVQAAGLVETLQGAGPFTVFAPTDDAFKAVPANVLAYLLKPESKDMLTALLTYHVVAGNTPAADVVKATTLKSVQGEDITVAVNGDMVMVNGAQVVLTDVKASNGVIHVIDAVILPTITTPEVDPLAVSGTVIAAGSSTVFPIGNRMKEEFEKAGFTGQITVDSIGTGAGFERFCKNAETDVATARRAIKKEEVAACQANNREPLGFYIAIDALAVAVSSKNTFADNLTKEDLRKIFSGEVTKWNQINAAWPDQGIKVFSPGTDSGTFDFFVEAILEKKKELILGVPGIQLSENDNVLVTGVEGSEFAIGYFGYAYYSENTEKLRAVNVEGITPNAETAESGTYPLSRPLYIYTTAAIMQEKPQVAAYVNFTLNNVNGQLGTAEGKIGYFPVSADSLNLDKLVFIAATAK
jgi:phosphate binding protein